MTISAPPPGKDFGRSQLGDATVRALFETMHEGFAFHEVICNDAGEVVDYRYLDINPAFEQLTGLKRETTVGRTVREVLPDIEEEWIQCFGNVALTGISDERESYVQELDRYYRARAYSPEKGKFAVVFEETTAQRRAQRELERREALYNALVETATDLIWRCDSEGRYIFLNKAWETVFGYPRVEMLGHSFTDFMSSEQAERDSALFAQLLATSGQVINHETVHLRKDGTPVYLVFNASFYHNDAGQVIGTQGTAHDISARKQAEEALREHQQMISTLVESSQDWIWAMDISGVHTYSNRAITAILNYQPEEFQGMGLELLHPEDRQLVEERWPEWVATRQGWRNLVLRWRNRDGSYRYLESTGVPMLDANGELQGFRGVDRDITERTQAEAAIKTSEERFRATMALSPDIISIIGADGALQYNSPAALLIHGYAQEEMTGRNTFDLIHPDDRAAVSEAFEEILQQPSLLKTVQYRYRNKDGSYAWMECSATNQLANPHINGVIASSRNIDARKTMEEERHKLEQQLLHAQKLESLGVLAGGIAHDFNNILTAIIGNAELAIMRLNPESPVLDNLQRIEKSAARAADLARQMLAYSGKGKFVVEQIDLNRLVEEMGHMLEVSISKKALLRYNFSRPLPAVNVDATQIRQIVMNLVINASEAIGDRSGVIAISTGCLECNEAYLKDVWLTDSIPEGLYVSLEIADTGCGMDKETLSRIFDPFFTTKFTGRGLGMAAVLGIIRGHKGAIKVYSEPGKGSSFKVLLPVGEKSAELFNGIATPDEWQGSGTVLLVDDEETVRAIGSEMLRELGFEVITATDGRDALEVYRSRSDIRAVVLDLTMPRMDGEQCFRELRQLNPDIKVIISSGFSESEVSQKFAGKGLAGFVQKPYKLSALREAVRNLGWGAT